jgi:hypothetical protein
LCALTKPEFEARTDLGLMFPVIVLASTNFVWLES